MNKVLKITLILSLIISTTNSKEITIGMSADFSGSISYLGNNMKIGIESYLNNFNKTSKHKINLKSYDDKYDPLIASKNVRKLIEEDKVIALLGNVGTPTTNVVLPILNDRKIALIGPYTGGDLLREKYSNKYIFNYRASYKIESKTIVKNLLDLGIKPQEIAVFSQNDTYGDSGYYGVVEAFREFGYKNINNIPHARYTRGTLNIENGLSRLLDYETEFKAIIMVSVDGSSIKFIEYAKEDYPHLKFFLLSPINLKKVAKSLSKYENDIYATQVVPILNLKNVPLIDEFKKVLKLYNPDIEPNLIAFEGYIIAKLFVKSIEKEGLENIDSKKIVEIFNEIEDLDIGLGFSSGFKNEKHQYSNNVWLTKYKDNSFYEVKWEDIFSKDK